MRHFHRTHITPAQVIELADRFFAALGSPPRSAPTARASSPARSAR
jgi:hypothetical protein